MIKSSSKKSKCKKTSTFSEDEGESIGLYISHQQHKLLNRLEKQMNLTFTTPISTALKIDHSNRPLYLYPNGSIILEAFSSLSESTSDFLITIAEPVSRPIFVQEFKITEYSLYAAISIGLDYQHIISVLDILSKTLIPDELKLFIHKYTQSFGKMKMVLKSNNIFLETDDEFIHDILQSDPIIQGCLVDKEEIVLDEMDMQLFDDFDMLFDDLPQTIPNENNETLDETILATTEVQTNATFSMNIQKSRFEIAKKQCYQLSLPLIEEYDFKDDKSIPHLEIELKQNTTLREYQKKSLEKVFGMSRARSGVIVLPCGAGKTLVGVSAACTVKKNCLVLCTSSVSVEQWYREFKNWSTIDDSHIGRFSAGSREKFIGSGVIVSTYTMIAYSGKRAYDAQLMMDFITSQEWGLIILDEVHVVPADMFRKVLTIVPAHCKLGLTATLVREDDKIEALNYLIGPKLYEANWMDLAKNGHIATVQCAEVWCPMSLEFYEEYLHVHTRKRTLLSIMNPRKIQSCQYLIDFHEARGDKIIVFSDNIFALKHYATVLKKPFIYGGTSNSERLRVLQQFKFNPLLNTLFLSKIGDTSIDLPEATCLIQISSHFGSRRQEAQRLGRILRAKAKRDEGFNAYFYTLISKDTEEMYYSSKRQQFLVDQGYAFKIITELEGIESLNGLVYPDLSKQLELLNTVLISNDMVEFEDDAEEVAELCSFTRKTGVMKSLSGADNMAYMEFSRSSSKTSSGLDKDKRKGTALK